jgi:hypothetical protein
VSALSTTTTSVDTVGSGRCQSAQLRLALGNRVSEQTQQATVVFTLTNTGTEACFLFGYPGIALLDGQGSPLNLSYLRRGDQTLTSAPPQQVNLAPGVAAFGAINNNYCVSTEYSTATTLEVIPPDDTTTLAVTIPSGYRNLSSCGPGVPGSTLDISPIAATVAGTMTSN